MEYNSSTLEHGSKEDLSYSTAELATAPPHSFPDQSKDRRDKSLDECIHELFEQQVERTPEATAVVFGNEQLSYVELNSRANQLAHYLRERGVRAEMPVGICLERSIEMLVGILGVLKAGGCYVPLDPEYPRERLSLILGDSGVKLLLTQKKLTGKLPPHAAEVVRLDADWDEIAQSADTNLPDTATPANLVYIIYTSGSTGQPKGVMLPHYALGNHMAWMQGRFPLSAADRVLQKTPFSFDASVWELFAPLLVGAQLVMAVPGGHQDAAYLVSFIAEQKITALKIVPSLLERLLEEAGIEQCRSLRYVFCGAEAMPVKLAEKFFQRLDAELFNLYGPTEAAIDATYWKCKPEHGLRRIPIGRPIINTQVYVLDERMRVVPMGVSGELYIGGKNLAHGYWKRADLTAERFVPHLFSTAPGAMLYRTGDVVRWSDEGELEYLGRNDQQVKIRGYRIEMGEIEATLLEREEVGQAVVLVREEEGKGKQLAAFVMSSNGVEPSGKDLREYLQEQLPEYMVPGSIAVVAELPLLPNGKIDRQALLSLSKAAPESKYEGARNEVEELLVQVWQEVLGIERVGIHDNFFELGGDSILSIQIVGRTNLIGLPLRVRQIFQHRTIAELAKVVNFASATEQREMKPDEAVGAVALTPIQQRFFAQELANPHHYNQAVLLETDTCAEVSVLEAVIRKLVAHHAALHLRFTKIDAGTDTGTEAGWQQVYADAEEQQLVSAIDLTHLAYDEQRRELEAQAAAVQASINISAGPLLRVVQFDLGAERGARLLIAIHHLVVDGVSWRILLEDLQTAYGQAGRGEEIELPARTSSFKRWSESLAEYAASAELQLEAGYWQEQGSKLSARLPVDYEVGENTVASSRSVVVQLSRAETQALLQEVPKAYHTQIQEVLATALALALKQWTGAERLLVDMEGHGREEVVAGVDVSRTVGWFTSVYPVQLELEGNEISTALKSIKEQLRGVPESGIGYGVWKYLRADEAERARLGELAEAEVSFNYLGQFDQVLSGGEFRAASEPTGAEQSPDNKRSHLLAINGMVADGQLRMTWTYSEAVHRPETIERVAAQFAEALRGLIAESHVTELKETSLSKTQDNLFGQWGAGTVKRGNSLLTKIRSEGRNSPLFFVSSYGDDPAFNFTDLAQSLGAEQPFYGLWIPADEQFSFAPLAARHIEEIKRVQPTGPYVIGGFSFGGVVAFEIARQLLARKEEVALLVLLETVCPTIQRDLKLVDDGELAESIVKGHDPSFHVPEPIRGLAVDERLTYILDHLKAADIIPHDKDLFAFKSFLEVWRRRGDYAPEAYDGDILLFRTQGSFTLNEHLTHMTVGRSDSVDSLGWNMVATKAVKIINTPGQHSNFIFAPHAATVAAKLLEHTRPLLQKAAAL